MMVSRRDFMTIGALLIATSGVASRLLAEEPPTQIESMVSAVKPLTPEGGFSEAWSPRRDRAALQFLSRVCRNFFKKPLDTTLFGGTI